VLKLDKLVENLTYFRQEFQGVREPVFMYPDKRKLQREADLKLETLQEKKKKKRKRNLDPKSTERPPFIPTQPMHPVDSARNPLSPDLQSLKTITEQRRESISLSSMPHFQFQKKKALEQIQVSALDHSPPSPPMPSLLRIQMKGMQLLGSQLDSPFRSSVGSRASPREESSPAETDSLLDSLSSSTSSFNTGSALSDESAQRRGRKQRFRQGKESTGSLGVLP